MAGMTLKTRVLLAFYSTRNVVGCALALAGLALFFTGIIEQWWLPIVLGLYAAGWLIAPGRGAAVEADIKEAASQEALIEAMESLFQRARKKLPKEAVAKLEHILQMVRELAPKLFSGEVPLTQALSLSGTITRDLPETINHYLKLPPFFAAMTVVHDGKTPKQLFFHQLDLLDGQLVKIAEGIYRHDADAVVANGKFLEEKFKPMAYTDF